jgi:hypothetical protein
MAILWNLDGDFPTLTALWFCGHAKWATDGNHQGFWVVPSANTTIKARIIPGQCPQFPIKHFHLNKLFMVLPLYFVALWLKFKAPWDQGPCTNQAALRVEISFASVLTKDIPLNFVLMIILKLKGANDKMLYPACQCFGWVGSLGGGN